MNKKKTRLLVITALFTALTAVCTAFVSFPVLSNGGYIHFGDSIIMLAAALMPAPFAVFVGAVGGALGDLLVGSPAWAPFTLVIKAVVALCISSKKEKMLCVRNIIGFIPVAAVTVGGYYLAESLLYGNWVAPVMSMPGNLIQSVGSVVIFCMLSAALDGFKFKSKLNDILGQ